MQSTCLLPTLYLWLAACLPGAPAAARAQAPAEAHFLKSGQRMFGRTARSSI
ncbi:MAG: hypothetical protein ACXW2U_04260 [Telluria sp.]